VVLTVPLAAAVEAEFEEFRQRLTNPARMRVMVALRAAAAGACERNIGGVGSGGGGGNGSGVVSLSPLCYRGFVLTE
jgi:hypothetical protein